MSRVLATSSEQFHNHHIKIQIQQLSAVYRGLSDKNVKRDSPSGDQC